jgi:murein DD-endopeptidase MepM/ murein hydrolase activator NlpD
VLAAGPGIVAFAGLVAGRGVVTVAHEGGLRTTYEPVIAAVKVGRTVTAGDELGVLAAGAHCPAACLHWGALRGDVYVDPLTLLRPPAPPVLLPLPRGPSP